MRETSGKWGEEVRTMLWEVSSDKERGQGEVTSRKPILGISRRTEEIPKAAYTEGSEMREVPRTAHGRSVVMRTRTRKLTDTGHRTPVVGMVRSISTRRWGGKRLD